MILTSLKRQGSSVLLASSAPTLKIFPDRMNVDDGDNLKMETEREKEKEWTH